jgi:hypothetical protein
LPTVIADQGWSQEKTLEKLCRKSGYDGSFASVADNFILIRRYQSLKFGMNHSDFGVRSDEGQNSKILFRKFSIVLKRQNYFETTCRV